MQRCGENRHRRCDPAQQNLSKNRKQTITHPTIEDSETSVESQVPTSEGISTGTVAEVTQEIELGSLARVGLGRIRIMSESRLLEVLRELIGTPQAATEAKSAQECEVAAVDTQAPALETAYKAQWEHFRTRQERSLSEIQGRVEKLADAFVRMETLLSKHENNSPRERKQATTPKRQSALLRKMLLDGEKPA